MPQPGGAFVTDVVNHSLMYELSRDWGYGERSNLLQNRMAAAGPPTPNQIGNQATGQPGNQAVQPQTSPAPLGGGAIPPSPAPAVNAGPRLLSPPQWAKRFMPNLASQPYISGRQEKLLTEGYKAYVQQVQNEQTQAHWAQQEARLSRGESGEESRFNRTMDVRTKEQEREIAREPKTADPMRDVLREAIEEMKGQNMTAEQILSKISADKRSGDPEASFLDRKEVGDDLFGVQTRDPRTGAVGYTAGLANGPEWDADPMAAFEGLKQYVTRRMRATSKPEEQRLLKKMLRDHAPYKTPQEVVQAFHAGKFDPPGMHEKGGLLDFTHRTPTPQQMAQYKEQAKQKAKEYMKLVFTEEEVRGAVEPAED